MPLLTNIRKSAKLKQNTTGTSREDVIRTAVLLVEPLQLLISLESNKPTMPALSKTELFAMAKSPPMIPVWKSRLNPFDFSNVTLAPQLMLALIQTIHVSPFHQLPRLSNVQI